jgi:hypothetical protein
MTPTTRPRAPRRPRIGTFTLIALTAVAPLLAACGGDGGGADDTRSPVPPAPHSAAPASSSPAASSASPTTKLAGPGDRCGTVTMSADDRFRLTVHSGHVDCAQARKVFKTYLTKLRRGEAPGNGGGGPVHVHGWTCVSGEVPGSNCRRSTASFDAKPL